MNGNVDRWPVEDLLKATAVIKDIGDYLTRDALSALVTPDHPRTPWGLDADGVAEFKERLGAFDSTSVGRFVHTIKVSASVARELADGLEATVEKLGFGDLPNPDDVSIPDTVPESWDDQFDPSGDCVAVDYDRCPACGDVPDHCQGHGEIGDNDGFTIVQAHENGIHDHCLTVEDVLGREVR